MPLLDRVLSNVDVGLNQLCKPTTEDAVILARDVLSDMMSDGELADDEWDEAFVQLSALNAWLEARRILHE